MRVPSKSKKPADSNESKEPKKRAKPAEQHLPAIVVTREEAAQMLRRSVRTIIRMEASGELTPLRMSQSTNSRVLFRVSEIEAHVQSLEPFAVK